MSLKAYIGSGYEPTTTIKITDSNLEQYFTVTRGQYTYEYWKNQFVNNNRGIAESNATIKLIAKRDMSLSFMYQLVGYSSSIGYYSSTDITRTTSTGATFYLKVNGQTIAEVTNTDIRQKYENFITKDTVIEFYLYKPSATALVESSFFEMQVTIPSGVRFIKDKAKKIKKIFFGVDGCARRVKKGYIGINGVARPFISDDKIEYYGQIEPLYSDWGQYKGLGISFKNGAFYYGGAYSVATVYNDKLQRVFVDVGRNDSIDHAGAANEHFLMFGGGCSPVSSTSDPRSTVCFFNLDFTGVANTSNTSLRAAARCLAAASNKDYIVFGGGFSSRSTITGVSTVTAYNSACTRLSPTSLTTARGRLSGASLGDYIVFSGGNNTNGYTTNTEIYDSSLTKLETLSLSQPRAVMGAAATQEKVFFAGGVNDGAARSYKVDCFDMSFTRYEAPRLISGMWEMAGASLGDYVIFAGGRDADSNYNTNVEIYDNLLTKTLSTPLTDSRITMEGTTINNYALFAGGYSNDSVAAHSCAVEVYTIV